MQNTDNRNKVYNYLTDQLIKKLNIGIYPEDYPELKIRINRGASVKDYNLRQLYSVDEAKEKMSNKIANNQERKAVIEIVDIILIENLILDAQKTAQEQQKIEERVNNIAGQILKNELIISRNQRVTEQEKQIIESMILAQKDNNFENKKTEIIMTVVGSFLFNLLLLLILYQVLNLFFKEDIQIPGKLFVLWGSLLASIIFTLIGHNLLSLHPLLVPIAFAPIFIAIIFTPSFSLVFCFFQIIFVSQFLTWNFIYPVTTILVSIITILIMKRLRDKHNFLPVLFYYLVSSFIVLTIISMINTEDIKSYLNQLMYLAISGTFSVFLAITISPNVEKKLKMPTRQVLLELMDLNNPLLKKYSEVAQGSYYHSLIVGNLAESAAEAIGANSLLARVAAYYHDIGKIENPHVFIENNSQSNLIHDALLPQESSSIIRDHVSQGIALAKKFKLPSDVLSIIKQHHGTSIIKYFYAKALEKTKNVDSLKYKYYGPKPQTKEAALVMIADIVESTTKSLNDFSESNIQKVIDDSIARLILEKQLDEVPITLKELNTVKSYMHPILVGIYRKRIEYPENLQV